MGKEDNISKMGPYRYVYCVGYCIFVFVLTIPMTSFGRPEFAPLLPCFILILHLSSAYQAKRNPNAPSLFATSMLAGAFISFLIFLISGAVYHLFTSALELFSLDSLLYHVESDPGLVFAIISSVVLFIGLASAIDNNGNVRNA